MQINNLQKELFIDRNYNNAQSLINESKEILLQSNFKIDGISFFELAIRWKDKEAMSFLKKNGYDLNLKDEYNETALSKALVSAPVEIIEHLIDLGANYDTPCWENYQLYQYTLHLDREDKLDIFNIFVKKGANPYFKIGDNYPIFYYLTHTERSELGLIASNQEVIEYELNNNSDFTVLNKIDNKPHTAKEWLASKTYINNKVNFEFTFSYLLSYFILPTYIKYIHGGKEVTKDNVQNIIDSIPSVPTIADILKVNALNVIDSNHYLLISPYSDGKTLGFTYPINKDGLSKVELTTILLDKALKLSYIHEEAHQVMFRVFQNAGNPYLANDQESIEAYNLAIKDTLVNIHQFWFSTPIEVTEFSSNYDLGRFVFQEVKDNLASYSISIKALGMNLGLDINCLGVFAARLVEEVSYDLGAYMRSFKNNNSNYTQEKVLIFSSFLQIYDDRGYESEDEHIEFIVRYPEMLVGGIPSNMLSVFAPIKEYYDHYVTPSIVGYITNHPNSHLIEE